jgi:hypothetical protein
VVSPERIQRRRAKGWRMPDGAVYVGRPTKWGNPWVVGTGIDHAMTAQECVDAYSLPGPPLTGQSSPVPPTPHGDAR